MGLIKEPKEHALTMQDGKMSSNKKSKHKGKEKQKEKEEYSKPFKDSSGSKDSSNSKEKKKNMKGNQFTYCNKPNHDESTCMKKKNDLMAEVLLSHSLGITKEIVSQGPQVLDIDYRERNDLSMAPLFFSEVHISPVVVSITPA
jgi:hypothetical protein